MRCCLRSWRPLRADATEPAEEPSPDGPFDYAAAGGKADDLFGACEVREMVAWLNDPAVSVEQLQQRGVHPRAARNLIAHRNGADGLSDTADDDYFDDAAEVDGVEYVGRVAFEKLTAAVAHRCEYRPQAQVLFSPQAYNDSHLARVVELIDGASRSIDIAMYSYGDTAIRDALARAVARGVSVRFIYDGAGADRKSPAGTTSAKLEELGADVRYVNKIMRHKFAIFDGPREDTEQAYTGTLITGSANWSYSAATKYDENTVVLQHAGELLLRFQREFNLL